MIVENFEIPASNSAKSSGSKTAQSANSFWGIELDFDPLEAAGYSSSSKKSSSSTNHRIISNTKGLLTGGSAGDSAKSETDGKQAAPETPSGQHVYVKIVEARRIPTQGLSSSLYCHILCGKESRKTRKIAVDSNPIWLEDFSL